MPYIGEQVNNVKQNTGIYTPNEILQLEKDGHWGGSLDLIEEQTVTGATSVILDDIKEDIYDVHLLQMVNYSGTVSNTEPRIRFYENGVEESAGVYQFSYRYGDSVGSSFAESDTLTSTHLRAGYSLGTASNIISNSFQYFYHLGNASKYSFQTIQIAGMSTDTTSYRSVYGGGLLPQASKVDGIKLYFDGGGTFSVTVKLYGLKNL
jgi:hypothetical protein